MEAQSPDFQPAVEIQSDTADLDFSAPENNETAEVFINDQSSEQQTDYVRNISPDISTDQLTEEARNAALAASEPGERAVPPEVLTYPQILAYAVQVGPRIDENREEVLKDAA